MSAHGSDGEVGRWARHKDSEGGKMKMNRKGGCSEHNEGELNEISIIWLVSGNKGG